MAASIAIVIVMLIINAFMVYAVIRTWERVNDRMEKYFLTKTADFAPNGSKPFKGENEQFSPGSKEVVIENGRELYLSGQVLDNASYKDIDFRENYKAIKENMDFSKKAVINKVIDAQKDESEDFGALELVQKIDFDTIFEISTLNEGDQEKVLRSCLNPNQQKIIDDYLLRNNGKFNAISFYDYIKQLAKDEDPNFYVKTGWKDESFESLGKGVVTVHDKSITEGVKIIHKDKLYDYSI